MVTAVYIPSNANANVALGAMHRAVSSQHSSQPKVMHIIALAFKRAELNSALSGLHQHVKFASRGINVYTNI